MSEQNVENNKKLVDSFIQNLKTTGKSPNTIRSYSRTLREFMELLGDRNFLEIDYADAEDFQNFLAARGNGSATLRLRRACLSSFSKYVRKRVRKTCPTFDNMFELLDSIPKKPVRTRVIWKKEKVFNLYEVLIEKEDYEVATLLMLAFYSGRRRNELTRFKLSDFSEDRLCCNNLFYKSEAIQTKGAGGKPLECYIYSDFKPYLDIWLEKRKCKDSIWLFPKHTNPEEHINDDLMGALARKIKKIPGYEGFHWHLLRHLFTTLQIDKRIDKEILTKIIGWNSSQMIDTYYDKSRDQQIEEYFKNNPRTE